MPSLCKMPSIPASFIAVHDPDSSVMFNSLISWVYFDVKKTNLGREQDSTSQCPAIGPGPFIIPLEAIEFVT